jgi:hypothetical protein
MNIKTLAQREIENAQALGESIRIHVVVRDEYQLPEEFTPGSIITLELMANRPLHLAYSDDALSVSLCFGNNPPFQYSFYWVDIVSVTYLSNDNKLHVKKCIVSKNFVVCVNDNEELELIDITPINPTDILISIGVDEKDMERKEAPKPKPCLRLVR